MTWVMDGLVVFPERMRTNAMAHGGIAFSQTVLLALVDAGMSRATTPTGSSSAPPRRRGTRTRPSATSSPPTPRSRVDARPRRRVRPGAVPPEPGRGVRPPREAPRRGRLSAAVPVAPGQGPRHLRRRRRASCSSSRPTGSARSTSILPTPIPDKGRVLTACSLHWFDRVADVVPNHVRDGRPRRLPRAVRRATPTSPAARCSCAAARVIPMECVVRGYLAGSGWVAVPRGRRRVRGPAPRRADGVDAPARSRSSRRPRRRPRATTCR